MGSKKSTVKLLAGSFYESTNKDGFTFIGSKEKAELFEQGKYEPHYQHIIENGVRVETEGTRAN